MKNALKGILNKAMSDEEKFQAVLALATSLPEEQMQIDGQDTVNPEIVQARQEEEAFMMLVGILGRLTHIDAMISPHLCSMIAMEAQKRSFATTRILLETMPPTSMIIEQLQLLWQTIKGESVAVAK